MREELTRKQLELLQSLVEGIQFKMRQQIGGQNVIRM